MTGFAETLPLAAKIWLRIGLATVLFVVAVSDMMTLRIPDWLSLPLIAAGLLVSALVAGAMPLDHAAGALGGFAVFAILGEVYFRLRGVDGLGLGDAKLFAAAGAWLGWQQLPLVLLLATAGGLAQAVILQKTGRATPLAFGPWLAFGFLAVWLGSVWVGSVWALPF